VRDRVVVEPGHGQRRDRAEANRANLNALNTNNFDVTAFNAWFSAYLAGTSRPWPSPKQRFSPIFRNAFEAWLDTNPATNPNAPPGPTYMPQYKQPELTHAAQLDAQATAEYTKGNGGVELGRLHPDHRVPGDGPFLAGIGSNFGYRPIRYGLAGLGFVILTVSIVSLIAAPPPP
jgi:hypothetical protein